MTKKCRKCGKDDDANKKCGKSFYCNKCLGELIDIRSGIIKSSSSIISEYIKNADTTQIMALMHIFYEMILVHFDDPEVRSNFFSEVMAEIFGEHASPGYTEYTKKVVDEFESINEKLGLL